MTEASNIYPASKLRQFFANILINHALSDPISLWNKFKTDLSQDILYQMRKKYMEDHIYTSNGDINEKIMFNQDIFNELLKRIDRILSHHNKKMEDFGFKLLKCKADEAQDNTAEHI